MTAPVVMPHSRRLIDAYWLESNAEFYRHIAQNPRYNIDGQLWTRLGSDS
jgi:hypothetical protein